MQNNIKIIAKNWKKKKWAKKHQKQEPVKFMRKGIRLKMKLATTKYIETDSWH